ncbi:serine/threonine-protein kinase [Chroococcidiopsis sp. TS-821]|uniref:serine/threonine-protein kinase n=1 Tax=Chroococcidiopsis sp. TS-821 TaxID=1378066 RepID=UPI000CEE6DB1|nr:serine/threonine-protein kinase [Chroococcidiopsis sp. TS-821]PPS43184.1 serine/threonine protein kinase [Chroococcidiopsis sp. TS-821]
MTSLYCNQGHKNQKGSRFCIECGEPLWLAAGEVLEKRYRLVRQLASGGFGRTYLAENLHRFNERCVLKEFAPQVQNDRELEKAKELFEREAGALYNLKHPQLPRFLEFFQAETKAGINCLFLAQDYIEGDTYYDLLRSRGSFSEAEVRQLLCKLLPVLSYIHAQGVVHRDIAPDNIILRNSDQMPVLIDFGGVKQVAATVVSQFTGLGMPTLIGKQGYAPEEQMRQGKVYHNSDLYALAVTALVLLTGKEPQDLYDSYKGTWQWRKEINISPQLEAVLHKMLAYKPGDRYANAEEVLQALQTPSLKIPTLNISQLRTINVLGRKPEPTRNPASQEIKTHSTGTQVIAARTNKQMQLNLGWVRPMLMKATTLSAVGLTVTSAWVLANSLLQIPLSNPTAQRSPTSTNTATRLQNIVSRRQALQIREAFFIGLVDDSFHRQHPELNGRSLKSDAQDAALRDNWFRIAEQMLDKLEQAELSPAIRRRLGSYNEQDYTTWQQQANQGLLGNYTSNELTQQTNQKFYRLFPEERGKKLKLNTLGQVWYAIAADQVQQRKQASK